MVTGVSVGKGVDVLVAVAVKVGVPVAVKVPGGKVGVKEAVTSSMTVTGAEGLESLPQPMGSKA